MPYRLRIPYVVYMACNFSLFYLLCAKLGQMPYRAG